MRTQAITHRRPRDEKRYLTKKDLRIQALQTNSEASAPVSSSSGTVIEKFDGRATDDLVEEVDLEGVLQAVWLPALFSPMARLDGG